MDLDSVARALGVYYQTAYQWVRTGVLPAVKLGAEYRVDPDDVDRLVRRRLGHLERRARPSNLIRAGH